MAGSGADAWLNTREKVQAMRAREAEADRRRRELRLTLDLGSRTIKRAEVG